MSLTTAQRYARALAELALEEDSATKVRKELEAFLSDFQKEKELKLFLTSRVFGSAERKEALGKILESKKLSKLTKNFLEVLARQNRFLVFENIVRQFGNILDEKKNLTTAHILSAASLSKPTQAELKSRLEDATGKNLNIEFETDESLLGGVVTRIGNQIFDGSVRTQLNLLKKQMIKGSQTRGEIHGS